MKKMKTYIQANFTIIVAILCAACYSSSVNNNQQSHLYRISMAESASGTQVTFNDTVMSLNEIGQALSTVPTGGKKPQILLLIDPKVPTAMYFDAMDMLRNVGMDVSVSILKWGNPELSTTHSKHGPTSTANAGDIHVEIK